METIIIVFVILVQTACTLAGVSFGYFVGRRSKIMGAFPSER